MSKQSLIFIWILLVFPCFAVSFAAIESTQALGASAPLIRGVEVKGSPIIPFRSNGDLWLNTWADDGNLYSSWGDGQGPGIRTFTDCGIARLLGDLPTIWGETRSYSAPKTSGQPQVNDKPSSLLFLDGRLVGAFHSPLGVPWMGYLAYSDDLGATWKRLGFYEEKANPPHVNASPWTRAVNSNFRCLFFINMGQSYRLNQDGYVYALAIGTEWNWKSKDVYLCRVPRNRILEYSAYRYYAGLKDDVPLWSDFQNAATPLPGIRAGDQGSAMLHPQLGEYLFLTQNQLFESPAPWGPWRLASTWNAPNCGVTSPGWPLIWQGGYQPGIISKGTGPDSFWFTDAGQNRSPKITYQLQLGQMHLLLRDSPRARVTKDPISQIVASHAQVIFSVCGTGAAPLKFQWRKDGVAISSATCAQLVIPSASLADDGAYDCEISNQLALATSGAATLAVINLCPP